MDDAELAVWSVMLGGLLTLAAVAFAFTLLVRSANALRYLSFVTLTGLGSLMRTGLVEVLLPEIPMGVLHLVKVCAGPLSAALVIRYMSIWLGAPQADPGIHRLASWGTGALLLAALVLAAALRWGTAPAQLSPGVLVVAALAAAANGALEEAFWRGALLPRPGRGAALAAGALFVAWHLAPAAGAALSGQDAARLLAGAALIAPVMTAARLSSGTAGTGALAHALVNFWVFSALAAANGHPL